MIQLNEVEVHARLPYPELVDALAREHLQDVDDRCHLLRSEKREGGATNQFLLLPAWRYREIICTKLVTVFPDNLHGDRGLPSVHALVLVFDGDTGVPRACLDGTALTLRKTAADSALGARFLALEAPATLCMIGAGALSEHLIRAHLAVRPAISRVRIWNRTHARAERVAGALDLDGVSVAATESLEDAVREADVVSAATMSDRPLIHGDWLKPGCHVDLVGSYTPDTREADDETIRRSRVYVDSRWSAVEECGDITEPVAAGVLSVEAIQGDLFQLCRGERAGRRSDDEITVFKNGGGGHLDLMVAKHLLQTVARERAS